MTTDTDHPYQTAIEQFQQLGLTEYAARCYIALLRLGTGTAREISETALVSTIQHHSPAEETVLWGRGETNSLVALLTAVID